MLEIKKAIALKAFESDYNCAQSVLRAHAMVLNIELDQAMAQASGFGGGMGRLQKTCGAVTGAFMTMGFYTMESISEPEKRKEKLNEMIQAFETSFKAKHGSTDCRSLLNCDLNTPKGQDFFASHDLGKNVCEKCIVSSLEILEEILK